MAILVMAIGRSPWTAAAAGEAVFVLWLLLYWMFHHKAARFALEKAHTDQVGPVPTHDWREHVSLSLSQANHGLITEIAFAGLMVFSGFGALSSLGKIEADNTDLASEFVKANGALWFTGMMIVTCLLELIIYLRVRVAIGRFSLQLDPTDRPFRPLRLTDSLLGYMLLAFLFAVSLHVFLVQFELGKRLELILAIDAAAFGAAVLVEQATLVVEGRRRVAPTPTGDRPANA
jgi:hypothetical protein